VKLGVTVFTNSMHGTLGGGRIWVAVPSWNQNSKIQLSRT